MSEKTRTQQDGERLLASNFELLNKLNHYEHSRWRKFKFWFLRRKKDLYNWWNKNNAPN